MAWGSGSYRPVDNADDAADAEHKAGLASELKPRSRTAAAIRELFLSAAASTVPPQHSRWWTTILSSAAAAAVLLALFVFTPRPWLAADRPGEIRHVGCGNSTAEAREAGCRFDVMSYAWVQPACFDQELMYEFLGRGPGEEEEDGSGWRWYPDEETADELVVNDVADGQREYVYVTWEYYMTHCVYMWKKMHRSLVTSRSLDSYVMDYRHTEQCEMVLMDRERQLDSRSVMLVTKYPSCPIAVD